MNRIVGILFGAVFIETLSHPALWGSALVLAALMIVFVGGRRTRKKDDGGAVERVAGEWVLGQAAQHHSSIRDTDPSQLPQALQQWLDDERRETMTVEEKSLSKEIQADLELARDFQFAYLNRPYPTIPETHVAGRLRLQFYHRYEAALALGGDFFDLIPLAPDTVGVFIADVMGHGARSALITAILRTLLRDLRSQGRNARHYITEVNRELCEIMKMLPQPLFASGFYFVPDTTSRMATFSTAGHPAPLHIHRANGQISRLNAPSPHGAALGIIPEESYTGGKVRLIDGDSFIFFTDGLYEAANAKGEEFGMDRVRQVIRKCIYKSDQYIVDQLLAAVEEFVGAAPVNDDICIVAVGVTTEPESSQTGDASEPENGKQAKS